MAEVETRVFEGSPRLFGVSAVLGLVGLVGLVAFGSAEPTQALFSYLTAFAFVLSVQLGALLLLMIGYAAGATWNVPMRRLIEAIASSIAVGPVLFLPVLFGAEQLYAWTHHDEHHAAATDVLPSKDVYLNLPFFTGRAVFYFAVWIAIALLLRRYSLGATNAAEGLSNQARSRRLSAGGLPVVGLTLTFGAIDWIMSLEPEWFSTMYGVYYFAGGFVAAVSLVAILTHAADRSGMLTGLLSGTHYHALGRLMLAFTIFWAYIAFFQMMLIYLVNRAEEVTFYVLRTRGGWAQYNYLLGLGHFTLPFLLLLFRDLKFRPKLLSAVGAWIVLLHYLDVYWLVMPVLHEQNVVPHVLDLAALLSLVGVFALTVAFLLRGKPVAPLHDPAFHAGVHYRSAP